MSGMFDLTKSIGFNPNWTDEQCAYVDKAIRDIEDKRTLISNQQKEIESLNIKLINANNRIDGQLKLLERSGKEIESLEAQFVDALGDGFYDGYLKCVNDTKKGAIYIDDVNEDDVMEASEQYESEHKYAKSIAEIKASALDDLYNELAEMPYVGVNAAFLKQRANAIRDSADKDKGGAA